MVKWIRLFALMMTLLSCHTAVKEPKVMNEQYYSLQYDEDWVLDTFDEDFDPDYYFLISSRDKDAFVSMFFYEGSIDPATLLADKVAQHSGATITDAEVSRFARWGKYEGSGALLKGNLMGLGAGEISLFACSGKTISFLVVTQVLRADRKKYKASFDMVEQSFQLKQQPAVRTAAL